MIKMNKKDFDALIKEITENLFDKHKDDIDEYLSEWRSMDNHPAIVNEPPMEQDIAVIDPKSEIQVVDENMPVNDENWVPGNNVELGKAMKQMADNIPESQLEWFYSRLKRLIDKTLDQVDEERMGPRLGHQEEI